MDLIIDSCLSSQYSSTAGTSISVFNMFFKLLMTLCVALILVESIESNKILPTYKEWSNSIQDQLESNDILLLYLHNWNPFGSLELKYENDQKVELGNYLSPTATNSSPIEVTYKSFTPITKQFKKELYSLAMTDLDSDPSYEKCHSIWENIKFNEEDFTIITNPEDKQSFHTTFDLSNSFELMEYNGPKPIPNTGNHRYVFILFRQPYGKLPNHKLKFRERWGSKYEGHGIEDWANYYGLEPLAVNYFTSSYED